VYKSVYKQEKKQLFTGTVSRDFLIQVFFMNHLITKFFQKSVETSASQGSPPVSTTPVANLPRVSTKLAANFTNSTAGVRLLKFEGKNLSIC
jgi:hypothetical protein